MTHEDTSAWPDLPTETEIYILPNGDIVVADLPEELAAKLNQLLPSSSELAIENINTLYVTE